MTKIAKLAAALIATAALSGCVVAEPAPYYGGAAPYYGTTYVPPYAYGSVDVGGYYPYHRSHNVYSNYNNNYWHNQRSGGNVHVAAAHGGGHISGGERH